MKEKIEIILGDISKFNTDAIICQANNELEMDNEITKLLMEKGGDIIQSECNSLSGLAPGESVLTTAGNLNAKFLVHAVIHERGEDAEEDKLMLAVKNSLNLCKEKVLNFVSIPLIGGGEVGIPVKRTAELVLTEIKKHLEADTSIEKVYIVLQEEVTYKAFEEGFKQL